MTINSTSCCGVHELDGIDSPTSYIISEIQDEFFATDEWENENGEYVPFLVFTDIAPYTYGKNLVKYIKKHDLGDVLMSTGRRNPNSGNFIRVFTWSVNKNNLKKYGR